MKITIAGLDALTAAAARVRAVPEASARAAMRAVNSVGAKVVTQSRRDISAQINLPQSYIKEQTTVSKASMARPVSEIRMRVRPVRMARFSARQLHQAAKHRHRAKGDRLRGIAPGRKQAGVSLKITRKGGRTSSRAGFLIPLRAGSDPGANGMGLFVRTGRGPKAIYHKPGPSPDQLFRRWRTENRIDIQTMLVKAYASQLRYELSGSRT